MVQWSINNNDSDFWIFFWLSLGWFSCCCLFLFKNFRLLSKMDMKNWIDMPDKKNVRFWSRTYARFSYLKLFIGIFVVNVSHCSVDFYLSCLESFWKPQTFIWHSNDNRGQRVYSIPVLGYRFNIFFAFLNQPKDFSTVTPFSMVTGFSIKSGRIWLKSFLFPRDADHRFGNNVERKYFQNDEHDMQINVTAQQFSLRFWPLLPYHIFTFLDSDTDIQIVGH